MAAQQHRFRPAGAFWRAGHAAEGDADVGHPPLAVQRQPEGAADGGDVLVEALGDLVGTELHPRRRLGQDHRLHEFALAAVLLAVFDEEILQRQFARLVAAPQPQGGAAGDQGRRRVADGGAVGDVAADGAHVAHLLRPDAADQLAEIGIERRDPLRRVAVGDAGPDHQRIAAILDPPQVAHPAGIDHRCQHALELGHPQPDIGRPRHDGGAGIVEQELRQLRHSCRRQEAAPARADAEDLLVPQGRQPVRPSLAVGEAVAPTVADSIHGMGGADDRFIAGAAAEIPGQRVVDPLPIRPLLVQVERQQRHDETRRAESALRAVAIDHRLLNRVQRAVRPLQMLHRQQPAAVQRGEEADAGVHRLVAQRVAVQPPDHHGAGAAVALRTAFLGADPPFRQPQPVQHRQGRIDRVDLPKLVAEIEAEALAHGCSR